MITTLSSLVVKLSLRTTRHMSCAARNTLHVTITRCVTHNLQTAVPWTHLRVQARDSSGCIDKFVT